MRGTVFDERLQRFVALTEGETAALAAMDMQLRRFRRGALIRREHETASHIFILRQGWAYGFTLLSDGSRQILKLYMTGDTIGMAGAGFALATETLVALTDVVVAMFDRAALRPLFEAHPRLAALLFVQGEVEKGMLTDRLASLGRQPARSRVAALLLDVAIRLRTVEPWTGATFTLPMTQEEIGDMIGLTAVHVNRMMRVLESDGLIARTGHKVTLLDEARLSVIANHVDRWARLDIGWLPDGR